MNLYNTFLNAALAMPWLKNLMFWYTLQACFDIFARSYCLLIAIWIDFNKNWLVLILIGKKSDCLLLLLSLYFTLHFTIPTYPDFMRTKMLSNFVALRFCLWGRVAQGR